MKVLIGPSSFGDQNDLPVQRLREAGLQVLPNPFGRRFNREETIRLLGGVDGLIAGLEPLDREVLASVRGSLKVISRCGAGMSNVDQAAAAEFGIQVFNTPDGPTDSVAEMTMGCLLALMRQVSAMNQALHAGAWDKRVGSLLRGKTVLIVGYGRIGRRVAELLAPYGVTRLVADPLVTDEPTVPLAEGLAQADVVLLHLSGEASVLDAEAFARLKPGAFLCNAARGGAVDEAALVSALESGRVAGAWLDALPKEPYAGPLAAYEQVLLTPHVASYTREGRLKMELDCVQHLIQGLLEPGSGRTPPVRPG